MKSATTELEPRPEFLGQTQVVVTGGTGRTKFAFQKLESNSPLSSTFFPACRTHQILRLQGKRPVDCTIKMNGSVIKYFFVSLLFNSKKCIFKNKLAY